jgi:hypothetical protein
MLHLVLCVLGAVLGTGHSRTTASRPHPIRVSPAPSSLREQTKILCPTQSHGQHLGEPPGFPQNLRGRLSMDVCTRWPSMRPELADRCGVLGTLALRFPEWMADSPPGRLTGGIKTLLAGIPSQEETMEKRRTCAYRRALGGYCMCKVCVPCGPATL